MQEMQNHSRSVIAVNLKKAALYLGVLLLVVLLDQITKQFIVQNFQLGESKPLIKGVLHFTYILNEGAAFGMLADQRWIFILLSTVSVLAITVYMVLRSERIGYLMGIALSMVAGGGIGNMVDRVGNGEVFGAGAVIDFIDFCAFPELWSWIFNIADAAVCVGAGLLFLAVILDEVKAAKREKAMKSSENATENMTEHTVEQTAENLTDNTVDAVAKDGSEANIGPTGEADHD